MSNFLYFPKTHRARIRELPSAPKTLLRGWHGLGTHQKAGAEKPLVNHEAVLE